MTGSYRFGTADSISSDFDCSQFGFKTLENRHIDRILRHQICNRQIGGLQSFKF